MPISNKNLYPPIFKQSYMPAFIYTNKCRIYFSLSPYNSLSDIYHKEDDTAADAVQVTVRSQRTNRNILNKTLYPSQIMLTSMYVDTEKTSDDKYYIEITSEDIQNGFELNTYYKIQIRFTSNAASTVVKTESGGIDTWLNQNLDKFSEWSSVVLIYGISTPSLTLEKFSTSSTVVFNSLEVPVVGKINFSNNKDKEKLKAYYIEVYEGNKLIEQSGEIKINNYDISNEINYYLKANLKINVVYSLKIQIVTTNLYSWDQPQTFKFKMSGTSDKTWNIDTETECNEALGQIILHFKSKFPVESKNKYDYDAGTDTIIAQDAYISFSKPNTAKMQSSAYDEIPELMFLYNGADLGHDLSSGTTLVIRRSSSVDNFNAWTIVDTVTLSKNIELLRWHDYTVQPGTWYKYHIIRYNFLGQRTAALLIDTPAMVLSEDIFLNADGKQLRIRFDPAINNMSIKKSESLTETIGSKYPFIRRNANVSYTTFSLSGTITAFMDVQENLFQASKEQIYQSAEIAQLYNNYNQQHNITLYNDYVYERQFRKKVIDFLYDNNVKLFRSLTQGNLLVKIMDVSLTPNATLGRLIYSFSCNVYEIDDCTPDNIIKYNITTNTNYNEIEQADDYYET